MIITVKLFLPKDFFLCGPSLLKSFIEFVIILLLFGLFGCKAHGILAAQPGIKLVLLALEEVLTTGPPGNYLVCLSNSSKCLHH